MCMCAFILHHFQIDFISAINSSKLSLLPVDSGTVCSLSEVCVGIVYIYLTPEVDADVFSSAWELCSTNEIPTKN